MRVHTCGNVGKRHDHEEGAATSTDATMEDPSPDDAGQTMWRRSRRAGRDEGGSRDFAEISRRMYEEIRSSRDPRDHVEDG